MNIHEFCPSRRRQKLMKAIVILHKLRESELK